MYVINFITWKNSPPKNNSSSKKSENISEKDKNSPYEHYKQHLDTLLLGRSPFSSIRLWKNDGSIETHSTISKYLHSIQLIVMRYEIFPSSELSPAVCRYSPKKISRPRFLSRRSFFLLEMNTFFFEPSETR